MKQNIKFRNITKSLLLIVAFLLLAITVNATLALADNAAELEEAEIILENDQVAADVVLANFTTGLNPQSRNLTSVPNFSVREYVIMSLQMEDGSFPANPSNDELIAGIQVNPLLFVMVPSREVQVFVETFVPGLGYIPIPFSVLPRITSIEGADLLFSALSPPNTNFPVEITLVSDFYDWQSLYEEFNGRAYGFHKAIRFQNHIAQMWEFATGIDTIQLNVAAPAAGMAAPGSTLPSSADRRRLDDIIFIDAVPAQLYLEVPIYIHDIRNSPDWLAAGHNRVNLWQTVTNDGTIVNYGTLTDSNDFVTLLNIDNPFSGVRTIMGSRGFTFYPRRDSIGGAGGNPTSWHWTRDMQLYYSVSVEPITEGAVAEAPGLLGGSTTQPEAQFPIGDTWWEAIHPSNPLPDRHGGMLNSTGSNINRGTNTATDTTVSSTIGGVDIRESGTHLIGGTRSFVNRPEGRRTIHFTQHGNTDISIDPNPDTANDWETDFVVIRTYHWQTGIHDPSLDAYIVRGFSEIFNEMPDLDAMPRTDESEADFADRVNAYLADVGIRGKTKIYVAYTRPFTDEVTFDFEFIKTDLSDEFDIEDVLRLDGAVFTLERCPEEGICAADEWELVGEATSGILSAGVVQFSGVTANTLYRLTETVPPNEPRIFRLPDGHWYIRLDENGEMVTGYPRADGDWVSEFEYHDGEWFVGNADEAKKG